MINASIRGSMQRKTENVATQIVIFGLLATQETAKQVLKSAYVFRLIVHRSQSKRT
jgi:hypothetical protein